MTAAPTIDRALELLQAGRAGDALTHCQYILATTPGDLPALKTAGIACALAGRHEEAAHWLEQALAREPDAADSHRNLSNVYWSLGRHTDARRHIRRAIELAPADATSHHVEGSFLARLRHWDAALKAFREAVRLQPDFLAAHLALGQATIDSGRLGEAVLPLQDAIAQFPGEPQPYVMMAYALARCGETAKARECLTVALARCPGHAAAAAALAELDPTWEAPLVGRHVLLRRRSEDDAGFLHRCHTHPEFADRVSRYGPRETDAAALTLMLRREQALHPAIGRAVQWIIIDRATDRPIGLAGLTEYHAEHRRAEFHVGILETDRRGTGAALEASLLALDFAFNVAGLHKLCSQVYDNNAYSEDSTLALGFTQEGHQREHYRHPRTGEFFGMFLNGLLAQDFRTNRRLARLSLRLLGRNVTTAAPGSDIARHSA